MNDLISRQAAIEAVCKDCEYYYNENVIQSIKEIPPAQPEIIRCKECRFAVLTYDGDCKYCQYLESEFDITDAVYFDGNDYCSHAERREE